MNTQLVDQHWFISLHGKRYGPYTFAALVEAAAKGVITADTNVWRLGWQQWHPASQVPGLLAEAPAQPAAEAPDEQASTGGRAAHISDEDEHQDERARRGAVRGRERRPREDEETAEAPAPRRRTSGEDDADSAPAKPRRPRDDDARDERDRPAARDEDRAEERAGQRSRRPSRAADAVRESYRSRDRDSSRDDDGAHEEKPQARRVAPDDDPPPREARRRREDWSDEDDERDDEASRGSARRPPRDDDRLPEAKNIELDELQPRDVQRHDWDSDDAPPRKERPADDADAEEAPPRSRRPARDDPHEAPRRRSARVDQERPAQDARARDGAAHDFDFEPEGPRARERRKPEDANAPVEKPRKRQLLEDEEEPPSDGWSMLDVRPAQDLDARRSENLDVRPAKELDVRPAKDFEVRPSKELDVRPAKELDVRPAKELDVRPAKELDVRPAKDNDGIRPGRDITPGPVEAGATSAAADITPEPRFGRKKTSEPATPRRSARRALKQAGVALGLIALLAAAGWGLFASGMIAVVEPGSADRPAEPRPTTAAPAAAPVRAASGDLPAAVVNLPAVVALSRTDPPSFDRFKRRFAASATSAQEDELLSLARAALRKSVKRQLANASGDTLLEITEAYLAYMQGLQSVSPESCVALSDESKGAKLTVNLAKQFPIQFIRDMSVLERVANTSPTASVTALNADQARPYLETVFNSLRQQPVKSELLGRDKLNPPEFEPYCSLVIAFYQGVLELPRDDKIGLLRYLYASAATDPDADLPK